MMVVSHRYYIGLMVGLKAGEREQILGWKNSVFDGHLSCQGNYIGHISLKAGGSELIIVRVLDRHLT